MTGGVISGPCRAKCSQRWSSMVFVSLALG
jgi:hypothetical protein